MTEKRYDVIYEEEPRGQIVTDNGIPCTARTCCTRLNHLTEENERLKRELEECKNNKLFSRRELERENKQLKEELDSFSPVVFNDVIKGTVILYSKGEGLKL